MDPWEFPLHQASTSPLKVPRFWSSLPVLSPHTPTCPLLFPSLPPGESLILRPFPFSYQHSEVGAGVRLRTSSCASCFAILETNGPASETWVTAQGLGGHVVEEFRVRPKSFTNCVVFRPTFNQAAPLQDRYGLSSQTVASSKCRAVQKTHPP